MCYTIGQKHPPLNEGKFMNHMELLMFSRVDRVSRDLNLDELGKTHPEIFQRMLEIHQTPLTENQRKMHLLQLTGYILVNCCTPEQVSAVENEIRREWPKIAPNTILQETVIFWLLWNDFPRTGNAGTAPLAKR